MACTYREHPHPGPCHPYPLRLGSLELDDVGRRELADALSDRWTALRKLLEDLSDRELMSRHGMGPTPESTLEDLRTRIDSLELMYREAAGPRTK